MNPRRVLIEDACRAFLVARSLAQAASHRVTHAVGRTLQQMASLRAAERTAWAEYTAARRRLVAMHIDPEQAHLYVVSVCETRREQDALSQGGKAA